MRLVKLGCSGNCCDLVIVLSMLLLAWWIAQTWLYHCHVNHHIHGGAHKIASNIAASQERASHDELIIACTFGSRNDGALHGRALSDCASFVLLVGKALLDTHSVASIIC